MNLPYQTILDGESMGQFWEYVKFFLFYIAPMLMIWVAVEMVRLVTRVIKGTTAEAEVDDYYEEKRRRNDDYW